MTEQGKEAVEELKKQLRLAMNIDDVATTIRNGYAQTILNLIEKLQKENEEYSKQLDLDYVDKNYIPKQKIKAKIEDLNKTINKGGIIYSLKQCARCQKDVLEKLLIEESED